MKNLNEKIKRLFSNYEGHLNAKITKAELQKADDGCEYYEAPVASLASGGATVIVDGRAKSVSLESPAKATFEVKKVHPHKVVYRISFSVDDAAKADADDAYFNTLVDPVLKQAIARYESAFGGATSIRYGSHFCHVEDIIDNGENVELRLTGNWASETPVEA